MKQLIAFITVFIFSLTGFKTSIAQNTTVVSNTPLPVTVVSPASITPIDKNAFDALNMDIVSAEFKAGIWTISGYLPNNDTNIVTRTLKLKYTDVFADWEWSPRLSFAIVTVPFKVRKATDTFPQMVQAGLTNIGLGINVFNKKLVRYLPNGTKSIHRFGGGFIVAPSFEELTPANTKNFVNKTSKHLFISTSLNFNYTYNDISFYLIPIGIDFATTSDGRNYLYNKKAWWGIGIGLSTKFLGIR